jgi:8-oxo-dGTP pyrophosphatase MutT (NUDIX family)
MKEMPVNRATMRAAVYLILRRQEEILLDRRCNTGFQDGNYSLVAGHVEAGESVIAALIREAQEEAGIILSLDAVGFVHLMHRKSEDDLYYFDSYFAADCWVGEVTNCEPHKCDDLRWFSLNSLPLNLVSYVRDVLIHCGVHARPFSEYGWSMPGYGRSRDDSSSRASSGP